MSEIPYWVRRGEAYEESFLKTPGIIAQEDALYRAVIVRPWRNALDAGCGFGRVSRLLANWRPGVSVDGFDPSARMCEAARDLGLGTVWETDIASFDPGGERWDLVVAAEVLMHVPPDEVVEAARSLLRLSRGWLVTADWSIDREVERDPHNWLHDYFDVFERCGVHVVDRVDAPPFQCVWVTTARIG